VIEQIKKGNVDPFRTAFPSLSFTEVGKIYEAVTPHFGPQRHFDVRQFKRAAAAVELSGVVVELGDHDGSLAQMALNDFPDITRWIGFDVCDSPALKHPKYRHDRLFDWFHNLKEIEGDAFVSKDTLEHMDKAKAFATLTFV